MFTAIFQQPCEFSVPNNPGQASKIFRRTFATHPETPLFLKRKDEKLPPGISSPCLIDISQNYTATTNVELQHINDFEAVNLLKAVYGNMLEYVPQFSPCHFRPCKRRLRYLEALWV